jgi:hypothetical protein
MQQAGFGTGQPYVHVTSARSHQWIGPFRIPGEIPTEEHNVTPTEQLMYWITAAMRVHLHHPLMTPVQHLLAARQY